MSKGGGFMRRAGRLVFAVLLLMCLIINVYGSSAAEQIGAYGTVSSD